MKVRRPAHCIIIPSFNSGNLLKKTVFKVLENWQHLILVDDGSTDKSFDTLSECQECKDIVTILTHEKNRGKGAAVLTGMRYAKEKGFTHAIVFDADGQHDASDIKRFIHYSLHYPEAMILGVPMFDAKAPSIRVQGRRVGNFWTNIETFWGGVEDSLYGFRVYPIEPSLKIMRRIRWGKRFDFDTQLVVRLYWNGVPPLNLSTPVTYKKKREGGITHFHYIRDNLLLFVVHIQLVLIAFTKIVKLIRLRHRETLDPQ